MYTVPFFPAGRSGALPPPTRGLAEWHPVGCFLGKGELGELGLEGYGGSEGVDDPLVVGDIIEGEGGIASVLQPLLCWLVATDVVVPYPSGTLPKYCSLLIHTLSSAHFCWVTLLSPTSG